MTAELCAIKTGVSIGATLAGWIPVVGQAAAVVTGAVGGMVGYLCGSKVGENIYNGVTHLAKSAVTVAKSAWKSLKERASRLKNSIGNGLRAIFS
jgi:hypothetical protein